MVKPDSQGGASGVQVHSDLHSLYERQSKRGRWAEYDELCKLDPREPFADCAEEMITRELERPLGTSITLTYWVTENLGVVQALIQLMFKHHSRIEITNLNYEVIQ